MHRRRWPGTRPDGSRPPHAGLVAIRADEVRVLPMKIDHFLTDLSSSGNMQSWDLWLTTTFAKSMSERFKKMSNYRRIDTSYEHIYSLLFPVTLVGGQLVTKSVTLYSNG